MRAASTTVLARDSESGPELLFVKRPAHMRFLGGFHAFPGGAIDPGDFSDHAASVSALSPEAASELMGDDAGDLPAFGFYICGIRELFEEVGILLAYDGDRPVDLSPGDLASVRSRLLDSGEELALILKSMGLTAATDLLRYHARWIAPEALPIRFDVRVFVGPVVGEPDPDPREVDRVEWLTPAQALAYSEVGSIMMAPPTVATVSSLSAFSSATDLVSGEREQAVAPKLIRHSDRVRRILAPNSSLMTGPGTNTYLVGRSDLVVIDPGSMERSHLGALSEAGTIRYVVVTHHHPDHLSGALELAETAGARLAASEVFFNRSPLGNDPMILRDGDVLSCEDFELEVLATPGHASDHICLWMEVDRALFSGDLVLGEGTTVISPPDGNLTHYLSSLEKVARLQAVHLYPGHFEPRSDAASWISWYIQHRMEREQQVLAALDAGAGSPKDIVAVVYSSYPRSLYPVAERSVMAHLLKLVAEGRVHQQGDEFTLADSPL